MTPDPTQEKSAPGRRLLLVDDDRLVLATLASGLTAAGYSVTSAESAEEAETWLAGGGARPDLAILDVRMPGSGGLALARRLHELDHIPFMMLSAYSDLHLVAQAIASGALGYAVKPQDIAHLVPAIETALARANELQDLRLARQQLQGALDAERNISVAVGIIMMQQHCQRDDAFALLRQSARRQRCKLASLAEQTIAAADKLNSLLQKNLVDLGQ